MAMPYSRVCGARRRSAYRDREAPPSAGPPWLPLGFVLDQLRIEASTTSTTAVNPSFTISSTSWTCCGDKGRFSFPV
jgi:hypothetical protein